MSGRDEAILKQELALPGANLDPLDEIMVDGDLEPLDFYPNLGIKTSQPSVLESGHNVVVIQPWSTRSIQDAFLTDPDIQLAECVSLGNTIRN